MLFDERFIGANATKESRDAWAEETFPQIKLLWMWMILLHFARLLPLDPVIIHWLSVLLRKVSDTTTPVTTSRYNSLRRTLLSNEEDGDTEDDSHISRVLRAYYTEKGRHFPPWLPPDPNDRRAVTPQPVYAQQPSYMASAGGRSQLSRVQNTAGSRGSLSDLWDAPTQPAAPMQPTSLRAGRRPMQPTSNPSSTLAPPAQARPLPSQRAGSYQSVQSQRGGAVEQSPPGSSGGGGTAQERLKARLWGGNRAASPGLSSGGVGSPNPYDQPTATAPYNSGGSNPYDTGGGGSSRRYGK